MRYLFIFLLLASVTANTQIPEDKYKSTGDIANMERLSHLRLSTTQALTLASANFDVKYYRCDWEVDPAIR